MSKATTLASGRISAADIVAVQLVEPADAPPVILLRWPQPPSVLAPTPKAIAEVTAALVRILAEAQSKLAATRRR